MTLYINTAWYAGSHRLTDRILLLDWDTQGRQILRDRFDWKLEQRDHLIVEYKAMLAKAAAEAGKTK